MVVVQIIESNFDVGTSKHVQTSHKEVKPVDSAVNIGLFGYPRRHRRAGLGKQVEVVLRAFIGASGLCRAPERWYPYC